MRTLILLLISFSSLAQVDTGAKRYSFGPNRTKDTAWNKANTRLDGNLKLNALTFVDSMYYLGIDANNNVKLYPISAVVSGVVSVNGQTGVVTLAIPYYADSLLRAFDSLAAHNTRLINIWNRIDTTSSNGHSWTWATFYPLSSNPAGYLGSSDVTVLPTLDKIVKRDGNANTFANNFISNSTSTISAGGTTSLTVASSYIHRLTGTLNQTFKLPDATTLNANTSYFFDNNSSGTLTVSDFNSGFVTTLSAGEAVTILLNSNATAGGDWDIHRYVPYNNQWGTAGLSMSGWIDMASNDLRFTGGGSAGSTLQRITKVWAIDAEFTNPIVGGITGNAGTASLLQNARNINGVSFNGSANIDVSVAISAGVTGLGTNVATALGTPTSDNFASAVTGELGTGRMVFKPADTSIAASYTLTTRDLMRRVHCTNASSINITIPASLGTDFTCDVIREGAGDVVFVASSTTLNLAPTGTKIKSPGGVTIVSYATANTYLIIGAIE